LPRCKNCGKETPLDELSDEGACISCYLDTTLGVRSPEKSIERIIKWIAIVAGFLVGLGLGLQFLWKLYFG